MQSISRSGPRGRPVLRDEERQEDVVLGDPGRGAFSEGPRQRASPPRMGFPNSENFLGAQSFRNPTG